MRYEDKLKVKIDIKCEIEKKKIVKFIIQPIVENAIYHGVEEKSGSGFVNVSMHENGDVLIITVEDNGIGIEADKLEEIRKGLKGKGSIDSVGLINVNERIKMHFGDKYGLDINSNPGIGTKVTVCVPIIYEEMGYKT
jgi:two-component system sensor histidine kinase YesM